MHLELPALACNAHCHVFGPRERFPYAADAAYVPQADAPAEALIALNDSLGLQRCVVVQSACHGFDNRATADALQRRPQGYRGIALLPTDTPLAELRRLDAQGFRGVRFNYYRHLGAGAGLDEVLAMSHRLADVGWHLQIHASSDRLAEIGAALRDSAVPVVIDHIGRVDASLGPRHEHFRALVDLLRNRRWWVKLSGIDRISALGPPYDDAIGFAGLLMRDFEDRVLWGNDWPHPNHAGPIPDERQLVDSIARFAPDEAQRRGLLVSNPQCLYRFGDAV